MDHVPCAIDRLFRRVPSRVLVVSAHPDDEILGLGATLARLHRTGVALEILHVTDGAPRNAELRPTLRDLTPAAAAAVRRAESLAALEAGGVERAALAESLGVADQEAGEAMAWIARALARRMAASRFDVVVTHPYEGGHPDHDATALAVAGALKILAAQGHARPLHAEMSSYFLDGSTLRSAAFLPSPASPCRSHAGALSAEERELRRHMLDAFASQRGVIAELDAGAEPLRCAPAHDFTRPPHAGTLHYERLGFCWTWGRWAKLAAEALRDLAFAGSPAASSRHSRFQRSTAPKRYL